MSKVTACLLLVLGLGCAVYAQGNDTWIQLEPASGPGDDWQVGANQDGLNFYSVTDGTTYLHVDNTGNVGIGVVSPLADKLTIAGSATVSQDLTVDGDVRVGPLPTITFSPANAVATEPDIQFAAAGLIAAESSMHIHIDSDNNGVGAAFAVSKDSRGTNDGRRLMVVKENGRVVIGADDVSSDTFSVKRVPQGGGFVARFVNSGKDSDGIRIYAGKNSKPGSGTNFIMFYDGNGTIVGQIDGDGNGGVNYKGFTGAHEGDYVGTTILRQGMLLIALDSLTVGSQILPQTAVTDSANDKRVYGVFNGYEADDEITDKGYGTAGRLVTICAVGDGCILVTDTNGDIEAGDLLTSSTRAGYAQKQDDDVIRNYTVAKARLSVDWSTVAVAPDLGFKVKLIPCTLLGG